MRFLLDFMEHECECAQGTFNPEYISTKKGGWGKLHSFPVSCCVFLLRCKNTCARVCFFDLLSQRFSSMPLPPAPPNKSSVFPTAVSRPVHGGTGPGSVLGPWPLPSAELSRWPVGHLSVARLRPRSAHRGGKRWRSFDLLPPTIGSNESRLC